MDTSGAVEGGGTDGGGEEVPVVGGVSIGGIHLRVSRASAIVANARLSATGRETSSADPDVPTRASIGRIAAAEFMELRSAKATGVAGCAETARVSGAFATTCIACMVPTAGAGCEAGCKARNPRLSCLPAAKYDMSGALRTGSVASSTCTLRARTTATT